MLYKNMSSFLIHYACASSCAREANVDVKQHCRTVGNYIMTLNFLRELTATDTLKNPTQPEWKLALHLKPFYNYCLKSTTACLSVVFLGLC